MSAAHLADVVHPQKHRSSSRPVWTVIGAIWIALLGFGLHARMMHATTEGAAGATPAHYPSDAKVLRNGTHGTLMMFVHPECPCTRASLHELAGVLARTDGSIAPTVVVSSPLASQQTWAQSPIASLVERIPGARVVFDAEGLESRRFGAQTSGYTVLYDADGRLQFAGGITGSRGHEGDNVGLSTLRARLAEHAAAAARHVVYGCGLDDPKATEMTR